MANYFYFKCGHGKQFQERHWCLDVPSWKCLDPRCLNIIKDALPYCGDHNAEHFGVRVDQAHWLVGGGRGVFADRALDITPSGEILFPYAGELVTAGHFEKWYAQNTAPYGADYGKKINGTEKNAAVIGEDGARVRGIGTLLNHPPVGKEANCEFAWGYCEPINKKKVFGLAVTRAVQSGEELYVDYFTVLPPLKSKTTAKERAERKKQEAKQYRFDEIGVKYGTQFFSSPPPGFDLADSQWPKNILISTGNILDSEFTSEMYDEIVDGHNRVKEAELASWSEKQERKHRDRAIHNSRYSLIQNIDRPKEWDSNTVVWATRLTETENELPHEIEEIKRKWEEFQKNTEDEAEARLLRRIEASGPHGFVQVDVFAEAAVNAPHPLEGLLDGAAIDRSVFANDRDPTLEQSAVVPVVNAHYRFVVNEEALLEDVKRKIEKTVEENNTSEFTLADMKRRLETEFGVDFVKKHSVAIKKHAVDTTVAKNQRERRPPPVRVKRTRVKRASVEHGSHFEYLPSRGNDFEEYVYHYLEKTKHKGKAKQSMLEWLYDHWQNERFYSTGTKRFRKMRKRKN